MPKFLIIYYLLAPLHFAQSPAKILDQYINILAVDISGITVSSISGVTVHPPENSLYVIDDATSEIFEITKQGSHIRTITLSGFEDTEGIAWQSDQTFFIVEERLGNLHKIVIPSSGGGPIEKDEKGAFNLAPDLGNSGIEGVCYVESSKTVYAVKEKAPSILYTIKLNGDQIPVGAKANAPFSLEKIKGDAAGIYCLPDGNFLILNQEEGKLTGFNLAGDILSELKLSMNKPEGVTVDLSTNRIYVVGEPRQLSVFDNPSVTSRLSKKNQETPFLFQHEWTNKSVLQISYFIHQPDVVRLKITSLKGTPLATMVHGKQKSGLHRVKWNAPNLSPGIYILNFSIGKNCRSQIILLQ